MSSASDKQVIDYDRILASIGEFGRYQRFIYALICLAVIVSAGTVMSYNFTGAIPDHRCFIPNCDNETSTYGDVWLNSSIPWDGNGRSSSCLVYSRDNESETSCRTEVPPSWNTTHCHSWVFDDSLFESTLATEFNLICDDEWKQTLVNSLYMAGCLFGSFSFGTLTDKIGRKLSFQFFTAWMAVFTIGSAFSPNYVVFGILRFISGFGGIAFYQAGFILSVELVGPKYRTMAGLLIQCVFSFGLCVVGLVAYFIRDWRVCQVVVSVPYLFFLGYWWIMPESVRWLISQRRLGEAQKVILHAAKVNHKTIPADLLMPETLATHTISDAMREKTDLELHSKSITFMEIMRLPILRRRMFLIVFAWLACCMAYYGLSFASANLSGNFYVNYELSVLVEIPSYLVAMMVLDKIGRRFTLSGSLLLAGLGCGTAGLVHNFPVVTLTFGLVGKFFITLAFGTVYNYTAELFPTATRSATMGFCIAVGKIGGTASPYVASLGRLHASLPYLIFGALALLGGVTSFFLPETMNKPLPETLEDARSLG